AVDGSVPVTCDHHSGDTFPVGTTTVACTAKDAHGNQSTASFTVTVSTQTDRTPPTIGKLNNVKVDATGPAGAPYTFTVIAHDPPFADESVTITCTFDNGLAPVSGPAPLSVTVTFPLNENGNSKTTHVDCAATDAAGNKSHDEKFKVKVLGAADQIEN